MAHHRRGARSPLAQDHACDHRDLCFLDFFACELIHINYIVLAFAAGEKLERGSHEPFLVDFQKRQVLAPMLLCVVNALGGGEGEHGTILKQEPLPESFATG
ncbi:MULTISPECIES: hypothetical protein [Candidatus Accumulibacter]|uniref:Uncharacterized protein n=2 Tax=Candidatus Accumulibacter TaxID=327159 RepID=A0A080LTP3_9PROT|nr:MULTISPECIES: hypothetical protein [Candidatus Accumulibacter]KFB71856.1 MAG: hypothetical protein AW09_002997 [Candidatus Accumulibacter phosphatis]MBL8407151.1 hypothetical protein [Accumulibacter sp.]NMQ06147.1 hypothetical protein [Candidatus Accumulibacter contiguus]HRF11363.1 hypothetical protein [Candidatus Accumulibacter phosphatis]